MRLKSIAIILPACLFLCCSVIATANESIPLVKPFYKRMVETLRGENATSKSLATLVSEDRSLAAKCLQVIKQRNLNVSGNEKAGYTFLQDKLSEALLLTTPGRDCSDKVTGELMRRVEGTISDEDKIFFIQMIIRLCPEKGPRYYSALGDLFMGQGQFGMALEAYRKAVATGDSTIGEKLNSAQHCLQMSAEDKPLRDKLAYVKKQYQDPIMAPLKGGRKVPYTIPTKKILFDEWSYAIKEQSLSELQDFGNALEREFAQDPNQSVLIEGHTDARGAYDRNVTLSKERAEAVKDYLVKTCNIDPNRLSTRGWGPDKPFSEQDNSSWALNRRVQFTLSK